MASRRRKDLARRRGEDEGDEEFDDDSLSEGSVSDEDDAADDSETSQVDESPSGPKNASKKLPNQGKTKSTKKPEITPVSPTKPTSGTHDTDLMMNGVQHLENSGVEEIHYEDLQTTVATPPVPPLPAIVESNAQMDQPQDAPADRRKREHEEYKKKRDADPAFVPNRGAFFMHDHRHAGPAANGFRPFGRGRGGRGGRSGIGGPFAPMNLPHFTEPSDQPWAHDMHDSLNQGPVHNNIPQVPRGTLPNRSLSTTKLIGNVQIRVFLAGMTEPIKLAPIAFNSYTRLPDHRPPLRRDKPVRISLPDTAPRYIYPAVERSFIFIPRAMRPNQQGFGSRSKGRSALGSLGGYSRRTSVYGGSIYGGGSIYTPSIALSRRSSLAHEYPRDALVSPTGSTRPVVRLPPPIVQQMSRQPSYSGAQHPPAPAPVTLENVSHPQTYSLPPKPALRENRPNSIPIHQPRPQKAVSVAGIESPATLNNSLPQQYQQPFHHQVPSQINGYGTENLNPHSRNASYPSQGSTGTPMSQIPERAIHAQPFQPTAFQQPQGYYTHPYQLIPQQQPGFYYPQQFPTGMAPQAASFVPQPSQAYSAPPSQEQVNPGVGGAGLITQEVNGMVYYYDASQIPAVATFPAYPQPQQYPIQQVNMGGMMTPSPDAFFYPQTQSNGVVYYAQ